MLFLSCLKEKERCTEEPPLEPGHEGPSGSSATHSAAMMSPCSQGSFPHQLYGTVEAQCFNTSNPKTHGLGRPQIHMVETLVRCLIFIIQGGRKKKANPAFFIVNETIGL